VPAPTLSWWNRGARWAGIGLLLVLGCSQLHGGSDRYIRTPPPESELVGVWRPDRASLARLARLARLERERGESAGPGERAGPNAHFVELRRDHHCTFNSCAYFPAGPFITDHACTWQLSTATAYVQHAQRDAPAVELTLEKDNSTTITRFYIVREHGRLVLWEFIGDPDYDVYMDFVKSNERRGPPSEDSR
jgi:hypothetical protein